MAIVKHLSYVVLLGLVLSIETNLYCSMIHSSNIRQRTEDIAEKFINRHGIYKYSIPAKLLPEYLDYIVKVANNTQQSINYRGQSFIDSEELTAQVHQEMQNFINTMNSIVRSYDLETKVTDAIHQELIAHGLTPDNIPSYMVNEYHQKGANIASKLRNNMFNDRRDYARKTEIEKLVREELRTFIQRVRNTQGSPSSQAPAPTWHWWDSLFGSPTTSTPRTHTSLQIQQSQLKQRVVDIAYAILRTKNINPDNLPARVVSDYSDAIQRVIARMQNLMAVYWRDYVWVSEIESASRDELQPIVDKINYKGETCSICLDTYKHNDRVGQLSCGHTFHNDCVRTWLEHQKTCPLCRAQNVIVAKIETTP